MKTHKIFLVFISLLLVLPMAVTDVFAENNATSLKKVKATSVKKSKLKHRNTVIAAPPVEDKALDLSLGGMEISTPTESQSRSAQPGQSGAGGIFTPEKKHPRLLSLDGQVLMSQEPEVDKKKSMDGAGISISLKR